MVENDPGTLSLFQEPTFEERGLSRTNSGIVYVPSASHSLSSTCVCVCACLFFFFWHVIVPLSCFRIATYFFLLRFRTLFKKVKTKLAVQKETRSLELLSISETHTLWLSKRNLWVFFFNYGSFFLMPLVVASLSVFQLVL